MAAQTKTQMAETIAMAARVFVRQARRDGCVNLITEILFLECAMTRRLYDVDGWTIRKAARLTVAELRSMDELHLIDWTDDLFAPLMPKSWGK